MRTTGYLSRPKRGVAGRSTVSLATISTSDGGGEEGGSLPIRLCAGVGAVGSEERTGGVRVTGAVRVAARGGEPSFKRAGGGEGDQFVMGMPGDDSLLWSFGGCCGESRSRAC